MGRPHMCVVTALCRSYRMPEPDRAVVTLWTAPHTGPAAQTQKGPGLAEPQVGWQGLGALSCGRLGACQQGALGLVMDVASTGPL